MVIALLPVLQLLNRPRIAVLFQIPISHLVPLLEFNHPRFSFADSALLFAFNSRLPAQIRK